MITEGVNLGSPLRATPDLKSPKNLKESSTEIADHGPGSFEQTLKGTLRENQKDGLKETLKDRLVKPDRTEKTEVRSQKKDEAVDPERSDKATQSSVKNEKTGEQPAKKMSDRQKVMQKFMDSMESEFGIPPSKLVGAMTQLSDKELVASPEDSASQVIGQLDLESVDRDKAEAMYLSMIRELSGTLPQVKDVAPMFTPEQKVLVGSGIGAAVLEAKERKQMLNDSLDRLSSKFFMKPEMRLPTEISEMSPQTPQVLDQGMVDKMGLREIPLQGPQWKAITPEDQVNPDLMKALAAAGLSAEAMSQAAEQGQTPKLQGESPALQNIKEDAKGQASANSGFLATPVLGQQAKTGQQQGFESSMKNSKQDSDSSGKSSSTDSLTGSDFFNLAARADVPLKSLDLNSAAVAGAGGGALVANAGKSEQEVNVQALMKQAQYMIKKGGGEVSVQMSPEGMGQVHLKVMVNEGKVNLEMQTQSQEAKRMIESSLGDLKAHLGSHKLSMESVRVDVGNQTSNSNDKSSDNSNPKQDQGPGQFKQDQGREQARQFFQQFHEDNLSRRDSYYDTQGAKAYSRSQPVKPLEPQKAESASARRDRGQGKGSGLDLVA